MDNKRKGKFIVFEGIDGSGKSTQIKLIANRLSQQGKHCQVTREQTDGEVGKLIRKCLTRQTIVDSHVIAALFAADRLDHILKSGGLRETLAEETIVLCDRYYLSSYAYQSLDIDLNWIMDINSVSMNLLKPDCHIFIDITPETAMKRLNKRKSLEIYEELEKLTQIHTNYHNIIKKLSDTENIVIIDGNRNTKSVAGDILAVIERM